MRPPPPRVTAVAEAAVLVSAPSLLSDETLRRAADWIGAAAVRPLPCGRGDRMAVAEVKARLRAEREAPLLRLSSVYFAKVFIYIYLYIYIYIYIYIHMGTYKSRRG